MSRIGRLPITIPAGVELTCEDNLVTVKGPKGTLSQKFNAAMAIEIKDGVLTVSRPDDNKENRALHGLTRTLIANMITGVTQGFKKELEINGIGYRAEKNGNGATLKVGLSNDAVVMPPEGLTIEVPAPNKLVISGADKQAVGQFAAEVRGIRPPEPYKGKGIKYATEVVRRKEGKSGKGGK